MTKAPDKEKAAARFDGVVPPTKDEPCAFKRACFRAGWDAAIKAMQPVGWQPIETAPKDGTEFDVWCKITHCHGEISEGRTCNVSWGDMANSLTGEVYQGWRGIFDVYSDREPTHWMPLPAPPQEAPQ